MSERHIVYSSTRSHAYGCLAINGDRYPISSV